ncbi:MAG: hypothetical protein KAT32_00115 [Candidatus Moranbacteria bacterium]|nr:hypothetical protein [Candidatus Moranbacteria bacterium]
MNIKKEEFINKLNTYKINGKIIYQYTKEIDKCNKFFNLIDFLGVADEVEELELNKKFMKVSQGIKQVEQDPNSFAAQYINNLKQSVIEVRDFTIDLFLRNDFVLKNFETEETKNNSIEKLKEDKIAVDNQIEKLNNALKNVENVIDGKTSNVIEKQISDRVSELGTDNNNEESAKYWMDKRNNIFGLLIIFSIIIFLSYFILYFCKEIDRNELYALALFKLAFFGLLYSQYYFAQKNYRIYADLLSRYRHLQLNAKILENYLLKEKTDEGLKNHLISKVVDLITTPVNSNHFNDTDNGSFTGNIITDKFPIGK